MRTKLDEVKRKEIDRQRNLIARKVKLNNSSHFIIPIKPIYVKPNLKNNPHLLIHTLTLPLIITVS